MTPVSGYDETVTHTPQEARDYAETIREARLAQTMPLLGEIAKTGDTGLTLWGVRANVAAFLEGRGLVSREIVPNPYPGARDRHVFRATAEGLAKLEGKGS